MVLASLGIERSELELRALCDCTPFGTEALNAVDAVRHLGFPGTGKRNLSRTSFESAWAMMYGLTLLVQR